MRASNKTGFRGRDVKRAKIEFRWCREDDRAAPAHLAACQLSTYHRIHKVKTKLIQILAAGLQIRLPKHKTAVTSLLFIKKIEKNT
jgi:hypothetical protein